MHAFDLCRISETWLNPAIASSLICPHDLCFVRKDELSVCGNGIAIFFEKYGQSQNTKYGQSICMFMVGTVYHPPDYIDDGSDLISFLINSHEQLLSENLNAKIIVTRDINGLNVLDLLS